MPTPANTARRAILGIPYDPAKKPEKLLTVQAFDELAAQIDGVTAGALAKGTRAELNAVTAEPVGLMAWVVADPIAANNGIYSNTGTAMAAVWTRKGDIPTNFFTLVDGGSGTPSAIRVTSTLPVPTVAGKALMVWNVAEAVGGPMTMSINGATAKPIKAMNGGNVPVAGFVPGMYVMLVDAGSDYRVISDYESAANVALTAQHAADAEAARDIAAGYASSAVSQGNVPLYSTHAGFGALSVPAGIVSAYLWGYAAVDDGGGKHIVRVASAPAHGGVRSADRFLPNGSTDNTNGGWWKIAENVYNVRQFGAIDGVDDHLVIIAAANALHAAGGGILDLPPGLYDIGTGGARLSGLSNIHIRGGGGTSTRLLKHVGWGGIAAVHFSACHDCSIRGVFTDSGAEDGNGIAATTSDDNTTLLGTRSTNIVVEDCKVTLQPNAHNYGIAFFRVEGGRIVGNHVDGQSEDVTTFGGQEGIECYGCHDIVVAHNYLENLDSNALSCFSAPGTPSESYNIQYVHNVAENCFGLGWINPSQGREGVLGRFVNHFTNIVMSHNVGKNIYGRGFRLASNFADNTDTTVLTVKNIEISNNEISFNLESTGSAFAVAAFTNESNAGAPNPLYYDCANIRHENNTYNDIPDGDSAQLSIINITGVHSVGNVYRRVTADVGGIGAYISGPTREVTVSDHFENNYYYGILVSEPSSHEDLAIEGCRIVGWDRSGAGLAPVFFDATSVSTRARVKNNVSQYKTGTPVSGEIVRFNNSASHTDWEVDGNRYYGAGSMSAEVAFSGAPGADGNRGAYTMSGGATSFTINTKRCTSDAQVLVVQENGAPVAFAINPNAGAFTVSLAAAADGAVFRWRVL